MEVENVEVENVEVENVEVENVEVENAIEIKLRATDPCSLIYFFAKIRKR